MPDSPDRGSIDIESLRAATFGDCALQREVLMLFLKQTAELKGDLGSQPPEAAARVHTLKGSARAIGAFGVADAAERLEAAMRARVGTEDAIAALDCEVAQARDTIAAILQQL